MSDRGAYGAICSPLLVSPRGVSERVPVTCTYTGAVSGNAYVVTGFFTG